MESKNEAKWDDADFSDRKDDEGLIEATSPGKGLVMRMCEYAFKVLNYEMEDFLDENCDAFDQDEADISNGRGETIEQFNIFKRYEQELEKQFDSFANNEGYSSSYECFNAVKAAVDQDHVQQKKMMEVIMKRIKAAQSQWQSIGQSAETKVQDETESKRESKEVVSAKKKTLTIKADDDGRKAEGKDDDEDGDGEVDATSIPVMMFFQPMSLESIVQTTLSIADYRTFSFIMRMKCRQNKLLRDMDNKINKQKKRSPERKKQLNNTRNLDEIYEELIDRLCELTPHREDIIQNNRNLYPVASWNALLTEDINDEDTKIKLKRHFTGLFSKLSQMSSIDEMQLMRKYTSDMMMAVDVMDGTTRELGARFLQICHDFIDRIEQKISEILHEQKNARKKQNVSGISGKSGAVRGAKYVDDEDEDK